MLPVSKRHLEEGKGPKETQQPHGEFQQFLAALNSRLRFQGTISGALGSLDAGADVADTLQIHAPVGCKQLMSPKQPRLSAASYHSAAPSPNGPTSRSG